MKLKRERWAHGISPILNITSQYHMVFSSFPHPPAPPVIRVQSARPISLDERFRCIPSIHPSKIWMNIFSGCGASLPQ